MPKVVFYESPLRRSRIIREACVLGLRRCRVPHVHRWVSDFRHHGVEGDVALFYGLKGSLPQIQGAYAKSGKKAILLDLGYWGRRLKSRYDGYHRFAVNAFHATAKGPMPNDRISRFHPSRRLMRGGGKHVLLCGQSEKAAEKYGLKPEQWERQTIEAIRKHTDRPIWYMPKNSWLGKRPIEGTVYKDAPLEGLLRDAWIVVSHHSNSSVHALAMGVPIYTVDGVAKPFSTESLDRIETPRLFAFQDISQFLADVAYLQWSVEEMDRGKMWKHLERWWL